MVQPYWTPYSAYLFDAPSRQLEYGDLATVTAASGAILQTSDSLVKTSLRVDQTNEDTLLTQHIASAQEFVAALVPGGRQFLTASYSLPVSGWWCGELRVPLPPLRTVDSLKYYATDGTLTTLATTFYEVRTPTNQMGTICRLPDQCWPVTQCDRKYPVLITFSCGYGTANNVPACVKQAMLVYIQWLYDQARDDAKQMAVEDIEAACRSILRPVSYGFYQGAG